MRDVYDYPKYYEIAFSFRDIPHEVDVLEECARRYSRARVEAFLELGCGSSPHMPELVRRGYKYIGLDLSDSMLAYAKSKMPNSNRVIFLKADMCNFSLDQPVQFAYVALGSLLAPSRALLLSHFRSVAEAVESGGLYLLDWCVQFSPFGSGKEEWSSKQGHVTVETCVTGRTVDPIEQLCEETIEMGITDGDRSLRCSNTVRFRAVYPQEFLLLVEHCTAFEFVGWWNDWNLESPLTAGTKINRPIVLLRRR